VGSTRNNEYNDITKAQIAKQTSLQNNNFLTNGNALLDFTTSLEYNLPSTATYYSASNLLGSTIQ